jgi:hypothetical protein
MQSSRPMPENPWPHEMLITIEDDSHVLSELLWIREAWGLDPSGVDLPPVLIDPPARPLASAVASGRVATWRAAWPAMWDACVHHAGLIRDPTGLERLRETTGGSPEREHMLRELFGPSWRDEFGDEALTEQYTAWAEARFEAQSRGRSRSLDEDPERASLATLVPAWRAGLIKIVTIPCQGSYTRIIGAHTLLVTEETRDNARTYSEALAQFQ